MSKKINITQELNKRGSYGSAKDKALTPSQRVEILKTIKDQRSRVLFILAAYGGLRVGEIEQCRTSWLNLSYFNEKEVLKITIPNETRNIKNQYSLWRPKTKRGRVTYIFDKTLYWEVWTYYLHKNSLELSIRGLQQRCYKITSGISIHALRATAQNYLLFEQKLPVEVIAVLLGHKDIRTTQSHYTSYNDAQAESYLLQRFKQ